MVLFFLIEGIREHSVYMAFHSGHHPHHYLDMDCVAALTSKAQERNFGVGKLPRYFVGTVIACEQRAAAPSQNPYHLPEGTLFTIVTAEHLNLTADALHYSDECVAAPLLQSTEQKHTAVPPANKNENKNENNDNKDELSFLSFKRNDLVLGLPASSSGNNSDTVRYIAFNEIKGNTLYTISEESVAAFQKKQDTNDSGDRIRIPYLVGKILMLEDVDGVDECRLTILPL